MALKFKTIPVTHFSQNCTLLWCDETNQAAIVDPGGNLERIEAALQETGVELKQILLTHGHLDHVGGTGDLAEQKGLLIYGPHLADAFWIEALDDQAKRFYLDPVTGFTPTKWLDDGDSVQIGNQTLEVFHTPGHTPGHITFLNRENKLAMVGDVLFAGSIGRTDFPGSDHQALINSIRDKLFPQGDDIEFIPGHGPRSTFGAERESNPFVADSKFG
ncbi:MBL fold metallo-hydrolase [Pelagibaculum spongiae]|uniref:Metallo-beta-lactamase domain-containing protein n=1 Tax=Pelagibaculum spongiae TaxID=2080658 RepID=A0A2V1GZ12_9GAMM|nr:MBL fold metallo-hydrolase [Pelagibaculum spongiae]PVZ70617.1 hypothetical protein DC094_08555 [Pelagibaculum spongiae]